MRIFELLSFHRDSRRLGVDAGRLLQVARELQAGKFDAILGGGIFKQRVARPGGGKSGGARVLLAYRAEDRIVFIEIFAKNELDNISSRTLDAVREVGKMLLAADETSIAKLLRDGRWLEIEDNENG